MILLKKSTTNAIKTASKIVNQKIAEAAGNSFGDKTADKITNIFKKSSRELHSQNNKTNNEIEIPKERYISPEKRQRIIDELRLA